MSDGLVLLVGEVAAGRSSLALTLTRQGGLTVSEASFDDQLHDRLRDIAPEIIVIDCRGRGAYGIELLRHLRDSGLDTPCVLLTGAGDDETPRRGWSLGAAAVLREPVDMGELTAALLVLLARHRATTALGEAARLNTASVRQLAELLVHTLNAAVPGAERRGNEIASAVMVLARQFDVPEHLLPDLDLAARLHELGRIVVRTGTVGMEPASAGRVYLASAVLLRQVEALHGVATLVGAMGAHWDGSGAPSDLQRGQIPLRSRLLRTIADLMGTLHRHEAEGDSTLATAATAIAMYSGTWYDPAVVAALDVLIAAEENGGWRPTMDVVPVDQLREGMVLATDLHTASGVKLLSTGAVLTTQNLQLIRQRNTSDPIAHGVSIVPDEA